MNKYLIITGVALLPIAFGTDAFASAEDDAKNLESYSVGDRRPSLKQEDIVIERPKFDNNFKMERSKPTFNGMQFARPQLEVLSGPDEGAKVEAPTGPVASADTSKAPPSSGETRAVRPLRMDPPNYPRDALRRQQEGYVVVEFTINANGEAEAIDVVDSEPRGTFDREAQRAVKRWRFDPALRDGRPVSQRIRHTLEFTLDGQ